MFVICGECGAYHKIAYLERKNKFEYFCGRVQYLIDPTDKVHALGKTRLLLIKPPSPVLN
jgi:hypothetical protein